MRIFRTLSTIILSAFLTGLVLIVLSHQIKIEVTTVEERAVTKPVAEDTTTTSTIQPTTVTATPLPTTSNEPTTTEEPRVSFDKIVNPHPFKYIRLPSNICKSGINPDDPFLLVLVKSNVFQIGHRMAIRSTWGNFTSQSNPSIQLAFLLGDSPLVTRFTEIEHEMYGDIIQEDFIDEYKNNTLKTIMGFNWAVSHCSHAKFVLFIDDDYFVNVPNLLDLVQNFTNSDNSSVFMGYEYQNAVVRRNKQSKWYISAKEYPDKLFPPYISGGSMFISMDIVEHMKKAFPHVRPIFIDDVYLGIVAKALNITLTHNQMFEVEYLPEKLDTIIASHDFGSPNVFVQEWFESDEKKR